MEHPIQSLRSGITWFFTDWTAKRITVLLLLAVVSEYILTDLQTTYLSVEGMKNMVESVDIGSSLIVPGILEGTIWFEADHLHDLVVSLGLLIAISIILILAGRKRYIRNLCLLYNIFLLFWIVYNVILMIASLWSRQGVAALHLLDATLIWLFCIFSFGIFYWVLDAELQDVYLSDPNTRINFLFPQTQGMLKGWGGWTPALIDYLFVSFTFSTSFGPTDTQVLSINAKILVMCQATTSLIIIVTIAAFAISKI